MEVVTERWSLSQRALVVTTAVYAAAGTTTAASAAPAPPAAVQIPFQSPGRNGAAGVLTVAVASGTSFRLGVDLSGAAAPSAEPVPTPTVAPGLVPSAAKPCAWGGMTGLCTSFGALLASPDGTFALYDAANATLLTSTAAPTLKNGGIALDLAAPSPDALKGLPAQPCLSNGMFGPPFAYSAAGKFLAFAVSAHKFDNRDPPSRFVHCNPNSFAGAPPSPGPKGDTCVAALRRNDTDATGFVESPNHPGGKLVKSLAECCAACNGDYECRAWIATEDLQPDESGRNCWLGASAAGARPRKNRVFVDLTPPPPSDEAEWWILADEATGTRADWYLAPAATDYAFTAALYELTGAPALPPRYAFGFMATYWGYTTQNEVYGNMTRFRDGRFPIDSFIMDYDWWNCGTSPGDDGCPGDNFTGQDFDFDYNMWYAPHDFGGSGGWPAASTGGPRDILRLYHEGIGSDADAHSLRMRFGGIRKPRAYSNVRLSNESGWLLPDIDSVGAGNNNWNFSAPGFLPWYTGGHEHFLQGADAVDFWWNDEGETQWFTYYWWNLAQQAEYAAAQPNQRFFTLNRAFTPGMQRFPAVTWTGDMQDCSHKKALDFAMWGQPYQTCDLTSPSATVLLRQYQGAVWWPIMRVHQMHGTPRFPWYWGGDEHQAAFRAALNTRYAVIPFLYSLAHAQFLPPHPPMVHPATFDFPGQQVDLSATFMVGRSVIAADLSVASKADPMENASTVVLPALPTGQCWFRFNTTECVPGNRTVAETALALTDFPVYVRAGALLPIHPWDAPVQHSAAQRGMLEVQVYGGADAEFDLFEDDGATNDYLVGDSAAAAAVRRTRLAWNDANRTLSWSVVQGPASFGPDANDYTSLRVALHAPNATGVVRTVARAIGQSGSVVVP